MQGIHTHRHWLDAARELRERNQHYVLVTVLGSNGSTPRDAGSKMIFASESSYGSIGGGHLEFRAAEIAAELLAEPGEQQRLEYFPLGPRVGQCCGGSTHLLFESFKSQALEINLFGAGHVGQALVPILTQLPCRIRWVDSRDAIAQLQVAANVECVASEAPWEEVPEQAAGSYYLIMTHNHQQDYDILRAVLDRGDAAYVGLIGSATKWRRFRMRLAHQGYEESQWRDVRCPVGLPAVSGKLPMEVAVSVAAQLIAEYQAAAPDVPAEPGMARKALAELRRQLTETGAVE